MKFSTIDIPADLRPYIASVWSLDTGLQEKDSGGCPPERTVPVMPNEGALIVLYRSSRPLLLDGTPLPKAFLLGPSIGVREVVCKGSVSMIGFELRAMASCVLFGHPPATPDDGPLVLEDIVDDGFVDLCRSFVRCYDLSDLAPAFFDLMRRKASAFDFGDFKHWMVKRMIAVIGDGTVPVSMSEVCRQVGLSQKTAQRYFQNLIGLSPKEYAGVVRFRTALRAVRSCASKGSLQGTSDACGYNSHPHMIIDFRHRVFCTPAEMRSLDSLIPEGFEVFLIPGD